MALKRAATRRFRVEGPFPLETYCFIFDIYIYKYEQD